MRTVRNFCLFIFAFCLLTSAAGAQTVTPPVATSPTVQFALPPVTVQNGHLYCAGSRWTAFGVNFDTWAVNTPLGFPSGVTTWTAAGQACVDAQLDNIARLGVRAVRIHNLDCGTGFNIFCAGSGPIATTRKLDPFSLQCLDYFTAGCEKRGIRWLVTLHNLRQLQPADLPANGAAPLPVPDPTGLLNECITTSYAGGTKGLTHPWNVFPPVFALEIEFAQQLLGHVNQYTGVPLGQMPSHLGSILENEQSIVRDGALPTQSNMPAFAAAQNAQGAAWGALQNPAVALKGGQIFGSLNKRQIYQLAAWQEVNQLAAIAAAVKQIAPNGVVIPNTLFGGSEAWACIEAWSQVGDVMDQHWYDGSPSTYLTTAAGAQRTVFQALLAGNSVGKPTCVSEWAPIASMVPSPARSPDSDRSQVLAQVVNDCIAQDVDMIFLYSWGHSSLQEPGSTKSLDAYDFRNDSTFLANSQTQISRFHDLSQRPVAVPIVVAPTGGPWGGFGAAYSSLPAGGTFAIQYPQSDPAILAVPSGRLVRLQAP